MSAKRTLLVRVFGPQAELAGTRELAVPVDDAGVTASELLDLIGLAYPDLQASLPVSRIAVDHQYAGEDERIDPASEIALIGLVSGG